jgi:hypothetical protein
MVPGVEELAGWIVALNETRGLGGRMGLAGCGAVRLGLPTTAPVDDASDRPGSAEEMCVQYESPGRCTLRFMYSLKLTAEELGTNKRWLTTLGFFVSRSSKYSR